MSSDEHRVANYGSRRPQLLRIEAVGHIVNCCGGCLMRWKTRDSLLVGNLVGENFGV